MISCSISLNIISLSSLHFLRNWKKKRKNHCEAWTCPTLSFLFMLGTLCYYCTVRLLVAAYLLCEALTSITLRAQWPHRWVRAANVKMWALSLSHHFSSHSTCPVWNPAADNGRLSFPHLNCSVLCLNITSPPCSQPRLTSTLRNFTQRQKNVCIRSPIGTGFLGLMPITILGSKKNMWWPNT